MTFFKISWIKRFRSSPIQRDTRFVDLAPTNNADETGIYSAALNAAMNEESVFNIALTGPYGSGKSSVIKSFLKSYPGKPLPLSLASFIPEGEASGKGPSKQEIERSILQQILYGADANRLPHSRFKRIQTPNKWSALSSFALCVGVFCIWYLFTKVSDITSGAYFKPLGWSNWFNYLAFLVGTICVWWLVHGVYVKSFGVSLKSVSLKDIQIAPNAADQESILNRHLDEIIYFFQSTEYDLVIIEDLDRFENPDIFVTLREINGLVNANAGIHRRIRFLYALRDDIFVNKDRTKFFEFIVPIIPIINHSNSVDKVLAHINRTGLGKRLNARFVREVSRYLDDMRLIGNIFNEYVIYSSNLNTDGEAVLDTDKLLAILIYKNVMPKDFAALHRQEGVVAKVFRRYDEFIARAESKIQAELEKIQTAIDQAEAHTVKDLVDLRRIYAMAIIARVPANMTLLNTEFGQISLGGIPEHPEFEKLLSMTSIPAMNQYGYQANVQLQGLEASVDSAATYLQRKDAIEYQSAEFKERMAEKTRELKREISLLRITRFNEVVRESSELIEEVFAEIGENRDLLRYLILEGYLDDTYYQYISLFHGERLSPNDHRFLVQIRSYKNPSPDFQLDNVSEIVASLREEDFGREYVLNRHLVDYLLENPLENSARIDVAIEFIKDHFSECDGFFLSYYSSGKFVNQLVSTLSLKWPNFAVIALKSSHAAAHAARILAFAPEQLFAPRNPARAALSRFLSENLSLVILEKVAFDFNRLKAIEVRVANLSTIVDFRDLGRFVSAERLYQISIENVRHIMEHIVGYTELDALETQNFTSIRKSNDRSLLAYLDANFQTYLSDVLLQLEKNTLEDAPSVIEVLNHEEVDFDSRAEFLEKQSTSFQSFDEVPEAFHHLLLKGKKIIGTWRNCLTYLSSKVFEKEALTAFLQSGEAAQALSRTPVPDGKESLPLRQFLIDNDSLEDDVYNSYVSNLPKPFTHLPAVRTEKIKILIREQKIVFSKENFEKMETSLQLLFIATNFELYWNKRQEYTIDDSFRGELIKTAISDAQKLRVISEIDPSFVVSHPSIAALIAPILNRLPIAPTDYDADFIRAVVVNSRQGEQQISLFNKLQIKLSTEEVRRILQALPPPYSDITISGKNPKIEKTEINEVFASWLKARKLISTFNTSSVGDHIRINNFRK
ncbi:ATP-binding protein [Rhizobium rhizogenes]|uniref:ATP-binding protein n=1 Tax=Rhizobium rhizogenes TaxID=359 RepID=A0AA94VBY5_RHIRH|nr:ATP-binding protein [Rhizobium rhizogenes]NSY46321.1 ATP-binding protein [Agrobacterium tumefaciens]TRA88266.1 ATP-binding protein [Rhizobium rhizogenes]